MDYFTAQAKAILGAFVLLAVLAIGVGLYVAGDKHGKQVKQLEIDQIKTQLASATAEAERTQRAEEQRRQQAVEEVRIDAQKQIQQATADAAAASAAANSMREQARRLAARASQACSNPAPATGSQAASAPAMVLADVLERADQRAGELAQAYDRARAAGLACERAYDALGASREELQR